METNINNLNQLIFNLEWQLIMGVDAMVEEKNNNYFDIEKGKINKGYSSKFEVLQKPISPYLKEEEIKQDENLQQGVNKCITLDDLKNYMLAFNGCDLKKTATQLVFSDGDPNSNVMIIGEAPGAEEDRQGKPFCGASGLLLDKMLASINLDRNNVYITNVIPWRPPGNRTPTEDEINLMKPFLMRHIEIVKPKILVAVGGSASKATLDIEGGILRHRGIWKKIRLSKTLEISCIATLHPAYLLRAPNQKKLAWEDLKSIRSKLQELNDKFI